VLYLAVTVAQGNQLVT